ncbi:MAG TPA: DUF308 domain-containing protein [Methylomirabilota bacterium]|nr:DUF308 domain-containing protein [Methylomirabilota bacterium]
MVVVARNWWALVLRGLLGIAFGVFAVLLPAAAFAALVLVFGAYAFVDGVFNIVAALRDSRGERGWWALLLSGIAGMLTGIITLAAPALAAVVLLYVIAGWAIVTGGLQIAAAVRLRRHITGEWLMALNGALSIAFGVLVMLAPLLGALAVVLLIGAYAFVSGVLLLALGFRLRGAVRRAPEREMRRAA